MNKSTIRYIFDMLYYMALIVLPLVLLFGVSWHGGSAEIHSLMSTYTGYFAGTDLYAAIDSAIGVNGTAPLLNANSMWFVDWIVLVVYATAFHLIIDCLRFIPACAHQLMNKIGGDWFE